MTEELEQLAVQLAALPDRDRNALEARVRDLRRMKHAVGGRLRGDTRWRWGALAAGCLLYDADGTPLAQAQKVHMRSEVRDGPLRESRREVMVFKITAYGLED